MSFPADIATPTARPRAVGEADVVPRASGRRGRSASGDDLDALLAGVDLDACADALLGRAERELPELASLGRDVRDRQVRSVLRALCALAVQALGGQSEDPVPGTAFVDEVTELVAVWGLSADAVATILALAGPVLGERLRGALSADQVLAVVDRAGRRAAILDLVGRVMSVAAAVGSGAGGSQEQAVRKRLAALPDRSADGEPSADRARLFVVRLPDASLRAHAALAQELRDGGIDAATGSDHVLGALVAGAQPPAIDGAVVVVEGRPRDGADDPRQRSLLEVVDAAERLGLRGAWTDQDLLPERLLLAAPRRRASLARRLRRLGGGGDAVLEAAEAFVRTGGVAPAASALGVHRETVRSRIRRAERLAGIDLTTVAGRSILALALAGVRIAEPSPASERSVGRGAAAPPRPLSAPPAFARIDVDELTRRAVEVLTRRALAAGAAGDRAAIDPERVREGVLEALRLLRGEAAAPWLGLSAESKRRLGQLTLGVPYHDAYGACAEALSLLWEAIVDAAAPGERLALAPIVERQWAFATAMHEAIALRWRDRGSGAAAVGALLDALAAGTEPRRALAARAHLAGLDVDERYRALVVVADTAATAGGVAMGLRTGGWAAVARGSEVVALVDATVSDRALRVLLPDGCVACASEEDALADLGDELRPLRSLVATAFADGRRGLLDPDEEVVALLLLQRPDLAARLRERVVGELQRHHPSRGPELVATLVRYVESGRRRGPTAEALHLHPNSLDYRLRAIEELLGMSFARPDDVLVLSLAVAAHRLRASSRWSPVGPDGASSRERLEPATPGHAAIRAA